MNIMRLIWLLLITVTFISTMSGCQHHNTKQTRNYYTPQLEPKKRDTIIQKINNWELTGKISIKDSNGYNNGSFYWQQQKSLFTIKIYSPLGTTAMALQGDLKQTADLNNEINLLTTNHKLHSTIHLPAIDIIYWLKGLPIPLAAIDNAKYNDNHQLTEFTQLGWQIKLTYSDKSEIFPFPHYITIYKDQQLLKLVVLRVLLYH